MTNQHRPTYPELPELQIDQSLQQMAKVLQMARFEPQPLLDSEATRGFVFVLAENEMIESGQFLLITNESRLVFYLNVRGPFKENHFPQVVEYITRANAGITVGNFEVDYDLLRVRFRSGIDLAGSEMPFKIYRRLMLHALETVTTYIYGLMDVADGRAVPQDAIAQALDG